MEYADTAAKTRLQGTSESQRWENDEPFLDADDNPDVSFQSDAIRPERITVLLLEPEKPARVTEIGTTLEDMQRVVGGMIEPAYFFDDPVVLVVNEEGKINGLPLNRGIRDKNKNLVDIIVGTAFLCGDNGEAFTSLSDDLIKKYSGILRYPERFFRVNGEIKGVPIASNKVPER